MKSEQKMPHPTTPENTNPPEDLRLQTLGGPELLTIAMSEMQNNEITNTNKQQISAYLEILRNHDEETYLHSLRVGIMAAQAGKATDYKTKPLMISGLLHDLGKTGVESSTLSKKEGFSDEDYSAVQNHVLEGFNILKDNFAYSAAILVRHHSFQENSYPKEMPEFHAFLHDHEVEITEMARLISILDFYDAITTRNNQKFQQETLDKQKIRAIILDHFPDSSDLVNKLYTARVLN